MRTTPMQPSGFKLGGKLSSQWTSIAEVGSFTPIKIRAFLRRRKYS
jgi:hypothetical protein